jgi:GT2 family glycosyltransferase
VNVVPRAEGKNGISIVIPTYMRDEVLVNTIQALLPLCSKEDELVVADQTKAHSPEVEAQLAMWNNTGKIQWLRLEEPSIPRAMNCGICEAGNEILLFLDDDIIPGELLIAEHRRAHISSLAPVVAGRVVQPWDKNAEVNGQQEVSPFNSETPNWVEEFMGGNFSVKRNVLLAAGGFDENFVRAAYRFERELSHRLRRGGSRIRYLPQAVIEHLKVEGGGTRAYGHHYSNPGHGVGEYYCLLKTQTPASAGKGILSRLVKSVWSRFHLARPWWIPVTLVSETIALAWAFFLFLGGPRYIQCE